VPRFYIGLDLGQVQDWTALAIIERVEVPRFTVPPVEKFHLVHLERVTLGTTYPAIVSHVAGLLARPVLRGSPLVVDATGVGRPVVDLFRSAGLRPAAVTITGGEKSSGDADGWRVPKRELVSDLTVLLQSEKLKVAERLPLASALMEELLSFKVKVDTVTAHDTYGAARDGVHDDLVLAVALACWKAKRAARDRIEVFNLDLMSR
jgi:hypothetical protein